MKRKRKYGRNGRAFQIARIKAARKTGGKVGSKLGVAAATEGRKISVNRKSKRSKKRQVRRRSR